MLLALHISFEVVASKDKKERVSGRVDSRERPISFLISSEGNTIRNTISHHLINQYPEP